MWTSTGWTIKLNNTDEVNDFINICSKYLYNPQTLRRNTSDLLTAFLFLRSRILWNICPSVCCSKWALKNNIVRKFTADIE